MKAMVLNEQMLKTVIADIEAQFKEYGRLNITYEKSHKPRTMAQMGFLFAALINQITDYFRNCGFNVDEDDVRYKLYKDVSVVVPEMVVDNIIFTGEPRIRHVPEMDRELLSKFIDGIFTVLDQDPIYSGLKLSADTFYNWVYHLDKEQIAAVVAQNYPERDAAYLDYVRSRPCIICGIQHRSEAHHLKDMSLCGMAQKAPDWGTVPVCHTCHMLVAHGTGFKEAMGWVPIGLPEFTKICYSRYLAKM